MQFFIMFMLWVMANLNPSGNEPFISNKHNSSAVELLTLKGNVEGNRNILKWQTRSEVNIREFIVETSADGNTFNLKAWITPQGTEHGPAFYNYADTTSATRTYYRLRMVAADGKEQVSRIISIKR